MDIPEATACRNLKILETAGIVKSTIVRAIAQYWLDRDMTELPNGMVVGIVLNRRPDGTQEAMNIGGQELMKLGGSEDEKIRNWEVLNIGGQELMKIGGSEDEKLGTY